MALWQTTSYASDKRELNQFQGGINNGNPPFSIDENTGTDEYGLDSDSNPAIQTRRGKVPYGASGNSVTRLLTNFGTSYLIRIVGGSIQWDNVGTWTNIATGFSDRDWDATNFEVNGKPAVVLTNGYDAVYYWDGTTFAILSSSAPRGKYITNDNVRIWIAKDDILYYSAFLAPTDWTSAENSGSVQYYTANGGHITALRNYYGDKYVWKANSMAVIQGTNYYNFRLREISNLVGCVNFKTVQEVQSALFWLGENEVYMFQGGLPIPIGNRIKGFLNRINTAQISKCFGATDGLKYYLGIPIDGATEPNLLLMYDPRPGYQIWRVTSINDSFRYSANLNNVWYLGDVNGQTYKMNQGTSDNGTPIPWMWISKAFDEGAPEIEKEYFLLHIQAYLPTGSSLSVYVSTEDRGSNFTLIDTVTGDSTMTDNNPIIIPLDTVPLTNWLRIKLVGSGEAVVYSIERRFRLQPVQI